MQPLLGVAERRVVDMAAQRRMSLPEYKRPFDADDFRGYFTWTDELSKQVGPYLYHACHADDLAEVLEDRRLPLRSEWALRHPLYDLWSAPGVWCGLNYFFNGNQYGPILLKFPLSIINGCTFMVFRRESTDRKRYFFVPYEAGIPIFTRDEKLWRRVTPAAYFGADKDRSLRHKPGAIYDLVLTVPLDITDVVIDGVDHPRCIPRKCSGSTRAKSRKLVRVFAKAALQKYLKADGGYRSLAQRFPVLEGLEMRLPDVDD